jgi:hypothetical protein
MAGVSSGRLRLQWMIKVFDVFIASILMIQRGRCSSHVTFPVHVSSQFTRNFTPQTPKRLRSLQPRYGIASPAPIKACPTSGPRYQRFAGTSRES